MEKTPSRAPPAERGDPKRARNAREAEVPAWGIILRRVDEESVKARCSAGLGTPPGVRVRSPTRWTRSVRMREILEDLARWRAEVRRSRASCGSRARAPRARRRDGHLPGRPSRGLGLRRLRRGHGRRDCTGNPREPPRACFSWQASSARVPPASSPTGLTVCPLIIACRWAAWTSYASFASRRVSHSDGPAVPHAPSRSRSADTPAESLKSRAWRQTTLQWG